MKGAHQGEHDDEDGQVVQHCRDAFDDPQPQRRQDGIFQKALLRQDGGGIRKEHPFTFTLPVGLRISW